MRRAMVGVFIILVISGCATHYSKSKEDDIYFYLKKPEAISVYFLCSTDGFKIHKANKVDDSLWEVKVPLEVEFKYFYIVDGEPFIPDCQFREIDDFGSNNCIFISRL